MVIFNVKLEAEAELYKIASQKSEANSFDLGQVHISAVVSYWFQELLHKPKSQLQQQKLTACLFHNAALKVANCTTKCFLSKGNSSKGKAN